MCLFARKGIGVFPELFLPSNRDETLENHKDERSAMHVYPLKTIHLGPLAVH